MKHLILTIPANSKRDAADILHSVDYIEGFTFIDIEGHGTQSENDPFLSPRDKVVGYTPRARVELLLEDKQVTLLLEALRESKLGANKHIIYWVTDIQEFGRLNIPDIKNDQSNEGVK